MVDCSVLVESTLEIDINLLQQSTFAPCSFTVSRPISARPVPFERTGRDLLTTEIPIVLCLLRKSQWDREHEILELSAEWYTEKSSSSRSIAWWNPFLSISSVAEVIKPWTLFRQKWMPVNVTLIDRSGRDTPRSEVLLFLSLSV